MFKKIALVIAALAVSAPAFADRGHRGYGHGHVRHVVVHKPHYVVHHGRSSCIARWSYIARWSCIAPSCSTSTIARRRARSTWSSSTTM